VAVGGGSVLDAAKAIGVRATHSGDIRRYTRQGGVPVEPIVPPVIAIPTTAGTGSEVTPFAVVTNHQEGSKQGFASPSIFPKLAIVDSELARSMPELVIVDTGLDALTHAVEAYISLDASAMSDIYALRAIEIVRDQLPAAVRGDKTAMDEMALAATLAGVAISHAGTTLLHVMGYPLTVFHQVPHGRASACMLPQYLDFLKRYGTAPERVARIEAILAPAGSTRSFIERFGVSTSIADYGVGPEELPAYVDQVLVKDDIQITPAKIGRSEITRIYEAALPS
jgi:alcohol dehydrogenase class IV